MKLKNIMALIILGGVGGSLFLLPYMKYYFYNQMLDNTHLSGSELGFLISIFGIASIFTLIPGGVISDHLSNQKCIFGSLLATALLTIIYSFTYKSYLISLIIWFLLAFSTLFLAWPALFKLVRIIGGENASTAYGIYYASTGITGASIGYLTITLYSHLSINNSNAYSLSILTLAIANIFIAFIFYYVFRDFKYNTISNETKNTVNQYLSLLKNPNIWLISLVFFCTYSLHIGMTFFNPYLTTNFGLSNETSGALTLIRTYIFMSLTPISGFISDRFFKSTLKWFLAVCPIILISLILLNFKIDNSLILISISMLTSFFVCTIYASMFSILSECKVPINIAGTAIGLVSVFAYAPDIIVQPLFGHFADLNKYNLILLFLIIMTVIIIVFSFITLHLTKKEK